MPLSAVFDTNILFSATGSGDPDDNMVLECAVEAPAQYIVSGDKDLLDLKEFRGIRIVRAAEFLKLLAT